MRLYIAHMQETYVSRNTIRS